MQAENHKDKLPALKLCLPLVGGILFQTEHSLDLAWILILFIAAVLLKQHSFRHFSATSCLFLFGLFSSPHQELAPHLNKGNYTVQGEVDKVLSTGKEGSLFILSNSMGRWLLRSRIAIKIAPDELIQCELYLQESQECHPPFEQYQPNYNLKSYARQLLIQHQGKIITYEKLRQSNSVRGKAFRTQQKMILKTKDYQILSRDAFALFSAITLGDRSHLSHNQKNTFKTFGIYHLLAISGMHVGILLALFFLFFKLLNIKDPRIHFLLAVLTFIPFTFLCGMGASVLRSVFMILVILLAKALYLGQNNINTLCFSAFVLLLWNPAFLYNVGFQLSFSAVLFILLILRLKLVPTKNQVKHWLSINFQINLVAFLGTAGILVFHFQGVYLNGILATFLFSPLIIILTTIGFLSILCLPFTNLCTLLLEIFQTLYGCFEQLVSYTEQNLIAFLNVQAHFIDILFYYSMLFVLLYPFDRTYDRLQTLLICGITSCYLTLL